MESYTSDPSHAWIDWNDNTTSVIRLKIIITPKKHPSQFEIGEQILAQLPNYGTWGGQIVGLGGKVKY